MPWLPYAERVAQLGEGTSNPQRLNKTVAKIQLSNLRTSCQINYPESASKYRVGPTIGAPPKSARSHRKPVDHLRRPRSRHVRPGDIRQEVSESFVGNHSGLFSDWIATSERSRQGREALVEEYKQRRRSRSQAIARESKRLQSRSGPRRVAETSGAPSMMNRTSAHSRHSLVSLKQQVESKRLALEASERVVLVPGTVVKRSELAELQKLSGFSCEDLRAVMRAFQAHANHDPVHNAVTREHFAEVMGELFNETTPQVLERLFVSMDEDNSGTIDYKELVKGCAKLMSTESTDERFRLIFEAYDQDGSGTISAGELMRIAHEKGVELADSLQVVTNVMALLDTDGTGELSFADFMKGGHAQIFLDAFERLLPSPVALRKHVDDLNAIPPGGESTAVCTVCAACYPLQWVLGCLRAWVSGWLTGSLCLSPLSLTSGSLSSGSLTAGVLRGRVRKGTFDWDRLRDLSRFLRLRSGLGLDHSAVSRTDFRSVSAHSSLSRDTVFHCSKEGHAANRKRVVTFQLMSDFFGYHDELLTCNMFDISASRIQSLNRFQRSL